MLKRSLIVLAALFPFCAFAAADFAPATTATNKLGLELFRQLAAIKPGENLLLSPYSIQSALAMTYAGADGDTRTEMARVLHFPPDDATLAKSFGALRDALDATAKASVANAAQSQRYGGNSDVIEWHAANRLYGQQGYQFREPFLALARDGYGAPLEQVDFITAAEPARLKINAWVEDQTRHKIVDLIPPNGLDASSRLVLVNALYLKAPWQKAFDTHMTAPHPFQTRGTDSVNVPTMRQTRQLGYAKRDGYTAVTLPYFGGDLQFLILLPDTPNGVAALAAKVTPSLLHDCANLNPELVSLFLPKFRQQGSTMALGTMLQALGMKTAFDRPPGSANFDRMAPRGSGEPLHISEVYHQTFIALDEIGTEAAAATAVGMAGGAGRPNNPPKPVEVHVDHPFLFAIQHCESGACLFLGRVTDPR